MAFQAGFVKVAGYIFCAYHLSAVFSFSDPNERQSEKNITPDIRGWGFDINFDLYYIGSPIL